MTTLNRPLDLQRALICSLVLFLIGVCSANAEVFSLRGRLLYEDGDPLASTPTSAPGLCQTGCSDPQTCHAACTAPTFKEAERVFVRAFQNGSIRGAGPTDSQGFFDFTVNPLSDHGITLQIEVDNGVVRVLADTNCYDERLRANVRSFFRSGAPVEDVGDIRVAATYMTRRVGECLGMRADLSVSMAAALNINDVILKSYADVTANRDPSETDTLGKVEVEYCDSDWSNFYADIIELTCHDSSEQSARIDIGFRDETIAHEYGHHVLSDIGISDDTLDGEHRFCTEIDTMAADEETAFSEAWGDYLAAWMLDRNPDFSRQNALLGGGSVILMPALNAEDACQAAGVAPTFVSTDDERFISVEGNVTAILYDLSDGLGQGVDAFDLVDGPAIGGHRQIVQIIDNELDDWYDASGFPDFYEAWIGRNGRTSLRSGQAALDMLANRTGIVPLETSGSIDRKPQSYPFVEANPVLEGLWVDDYDAATNEHEFEVSYSFARDIVVPAPINLALGASNLAPGNTHIDSGAGSADQASGADIDLRSLTFDPPPPAPWLRARLQGVGSEVPAGGLRTLEISFDTEAVHWLPRGTHRAVLEIDFDLTRSAGGVITKSRTVTVELVKHDGPHDDPDHDGLTSLEELSEQSRYSCLSLRDADSDGDGLSDGVEVEVHMTNPCLIDTDGDGGLDTLEVSFSCFTATEPDADAAYEDDKDGDGLTNGEEWISGLNPCSDDSDDDGALDGVDNCAKQSNPDQADLDEDEIGDECDNDIDGDGVPNMLDQAERDPEVGSFIDLEDLVSWQRLGFYERHSLACVPICDPRVCDPEVGFLNRGWFPDEGGCSGPDCERPELVYLKSRLAPRGLVRPQMLGLSRESGFPGTIRPLPDVNGDGICDLAATAPFAVGDLGERDLGRVYFLSGDGLGEIQHLDGPAEGARFGGAMELLGDGRLAIGAPGDLTCPGEVHIIDLENRDLEAVLSAGVPGDGFGATLLSLPPLAEGEADQLVIGAPGSEGSAWAGSVHLAPTDGSASPRLLGVGPKNGSRFGAALAAGDVTGNGTADLLVGAPRAYGDRGEVRMLNLDGGAMWSVYGAFEGDQLGASIVPILERRRGWVSGSPQTEPPTWPRPDDPLLGFMAGAPGTSNKLGDQVGGVSYLTPWGEERMFIEGVGGYQALGTRISVAEDFNGDGTAALALGGFDSVGHAVTIFFEPTNPAVACQDGLDNDEDEAVDWNGASGKPADLDCVDRPWRSTESACGLGFEGALLIGLLRLRGRWRRRGARRS